MDAAADFSLEQSEAGTTAILTGDWTATRIGDAGQRLAQAAGQADDLSLDLREIGRCDTAGAYSIIQAAEKQGATAKLKARPEIKRLMELVEQATHAEPTTPPPRTGFFDLMDRLGRGVIGVGREFYELMIFNGHLLSAVGRCIAKPRRIRWAAVVSAMERTGLDALPIVTVTTLFIGAVVGLLGANMLRDFGAQVFAVELIGIGVMREFNVLITAVLLAGRSSSAFAAEIGAMKMNQEIDAMEVMGVDPFEALVLPRFVALLLMTPLLVFVATLAGLAGGGLVVWAALDLTPTFFLQRIVDNVGATQFWIGLSKAPVMATVIAAIGCRQGMETGGDVGSLGRHVTSAVVHAIFSIILIDAVFALIYMELNI
jgi:phospholipid/cholesterol/gamma-HCH transport system permease protein